MTATVHQLPLDVATTTAAKPQPYTELFENWWGVARRNMARNGRVIGKKASFKEFKAVCPSKVSAHDLGAATVAYGEFCRKADRFPVDPERFLKRHLWEDFLPDSDSAPETPPVEVQSDLSGPICDEWRDVAQRLIDRREMPATWLPYLVLVGLDEQNRPMLRCKTVFARTHTISRYEQAIRRAWGREVVVL